MGLPPNLVISTVKLPKRPPLWHQIWILATIFRFDFPHQSPRHGKPYITRICHPRRESGGPFRGLKGNREKFALSCCLSWADGVVVEELGNLVGEVMVRASADCRPDCRVIG
jgi:hypothetical protein